MNRFLVVAFMVVLGFIGCAKWDDDLPDGLLGIGGGGDSTSTFSLTVTNGSGSGNYAVGAKVSVVAKDSAGYHFDKWTGDIANLDTVNNKSVKVTMPDSAISITATYAKDVVPTYSLTVINGTGSGDYVADTVVSVVAKDSTGYSFDKWTGDTANLDTVSNKSAKVTMPDSAISITATYAKNSVGTFSLAITSDKGTVEKTPDATSYDSGSVVEIKATANTGYTFTSWSGDLSGNSNPATVVVNKNKAITAIYTPKNYTVTITATNGTVTKTPNQTTYPFDSKVSFKAVPNTGYVFSGWSGDTTGTSNPVELTIGEVNSLTANFVIKNYTLTVTPTNCTVTKNPDKASYDHGDDVQLSASYAPGYSFTGWGGDASGTTNPLTITMDGSKTITATATQNHYTITTSCYNGTVTKNPDKSSYVYGDQVTLTATANDGSYTFNGWSGGSTSSNESITITVKSDSSFSASYKDPNATAPAGMVVIPGGTFQMGQDGVATPVHTVTVGW